MRANLLNASAIAVLCAAALAACGSNPSTTVPFKGIKPRPDDAHTVYIYSSLPLNGPLKQESEDIIAGIRLPLAEQDGSIGEFKVIYKSLNDATRSAGGWSLKPTETNAEIAAHNPQTVLYVGDLNSGATKVSLPILNQAGIVQVTPGSSYVGLTDKFPGVTASGEPDKYYPSPARTRTLLRLIPSDAVEAAAGLGVLKAKGCDHIAAASFGPGGDAGPLRQLFLAQAKAFGLTPVTVPHAPGSTLASLTAYASEIGDLGVGCFVMTGRVTPAAVTLTRLIHAALPRYVILGTSGFCNPSWTDPRRHGVPSFVDPYLYCVSPVLPLDDYPDAQEFIDEYQAVHGSKAKPSAYMLYGYEAEAMAADAIAAMGTGDDNRKVAQSSLLGGATHYSPVLGVYSFDPNGDTTSNKYGLYRVGGDGKPVFDGLLSPPKVP